MIEKQPVDTIVPDYIIKTGRRTLFNNDPKEKQLGPDGSTSSFVNSQGLRIASYYWPVRRQQCPSLIQNPPDAVFCVPK